MGRWKACLNICVAWGDGYRAEKEGFKQILGNICKLEKAISTLVMFVYSNLFKPAVRRKQNTFPLLHATEAVNLKLRTHISTQTQTINLLRCSQRY